MGKRNKPTANDLKEFRRRFKVAGGNLVVKAPIPRSKYKIGDFINTRIANGYMSFMVNKRAFRVHRVIYYLSYGVWPGDLHVDHINGDRLDNRPENLRLLTASQNARSYRSVSPSAASPYRGVGWSKRWEKYTSGIKVNNKSINLGLYTSEKEAAIAYNYSALGHGFNAEAFNKVFEDMPQEVLDVEA